LSRHGTDRPRVWKERPAAGQGIHFRGRYFKLKKQHFHAGGSAY